MSARIDERVFVTAGDIRPVEFAARLLEDARNGEGKIYESAYVERPTGQEGVEVVGGPKTGARATAPIERT